MFNWLKKILGIGPSLPAAVEAAIPAVEEVAKEESNPKETKKTTTKKTSGKKGTGKCDFDKLTKTQLLAEAKHRGVKANASMNKAALVKAIKNG